MEKEERIANTNEIDEETIKAKYKLSEEEHEKIGQEIIKIMLHDKFPVDSPKAILDIAPPASGKTALNSYGCSQFVDNNVVVINSDELKPFHPKVDEIAKLYPQYYTKITDQESNSWTSDLFDKVLREGYNVIFEGTGRNARILNTIRDKMSQYNVTVRALSVHELNCLISLIQRYEYQVEKKGWGRLVTLDHLYETYNEMPNTIDAIEKSGIVDTVEIYKRGSVPTEPIKIYDSGDRENGRFGNARFAILGGRKEDEKLANADFNVKFNEVLSVIDKRNISQEELNILKKIKSLNEKYINNDLEDNIEL